MVRQGRRNGKPRRRGPLLATGLHRLLTARLIWPKRKLFRHFFPILSLVTLMPIFGLRFRTLGQTSYYSGPPDLKRGDYVLIEADQGRTLAQVVSGPVETLPGIEEASLPSVLRRADPEELRQGQENESLAREALVFCRQCIRERRLDMKLVDVEVFFVAAS